MQVTKKNIILALGSNYGDRESYIKETILLIKKYKILTNIKISKIYQSPALLKNNSPKSWQKDFLNLAIMGETKLEPLQLLKKTKEVEQEIGRIDRGIWAPREIDIDILFYDQIVLAKANLTIPHKDFLNRDFALIPACDLLPNFLYPKKGQFFHKKLQKILQEKNFNLPSCIINNL